jgi:hypothetical protein
MQMWRIKYKEFSYIILAMFTNILKPVASLLLNDLV